MSRKDGPSFFHKARSIRHLNQSDVAGRLGITQAAISNLERRPDRIPWGRVRQLAATLARPLQFFLTGHDTLPLTNDVIVSELKHWGIRDLAISETPVVGAFHRIEETVAAGLTGTPHPRIILGLPVVLMINTWSPNILAAFAREYGVEQRTGFVADVASTLLTSGTSHSGILVDVARRLQSLIDELAGRPSVSDDIGVPAEDPRALSPVHRRWRVTFGSPISAFRDRATALLEDSRS